MSESVLTLGREEDAWQLIQDILSGEEIGDFTEIEFGEWPILKIKLTGPKFHSSLTPKVMEAFIHLQRDI